MPSLFWISLTALLYSYIAFPLLVLVRALILHRPVQEGDVVPNISFIIVAHNEAASLAKKLPMLRELDYDQSRVEIIVASDGSADDTRPIIEQHPGWRVLLLDLPRGGKARALNAAMARASGDVLVFSDANSLLRRDALRKLVRPFRDPAVGAVAGDQRYVPSGRPEATIGERRYWDFDRVIKWAESRAGSAVSATGALYAVKRELVTEVPEDVTDDFFLSTAAIASGFRLVFAGEAVAYETVAETPRLEFQRKVRVMTRGLRAVAARRELLDPRAHGFYAFELFSHKVLRRLMVIPLIGLAIGSVGAQRRHPFYRVAALSQAALYAAGGLSLLAPRVERRIPGGAVSAYFLMVNAASAVAVWNVIVGKRITGWSPQRNALDAALEAVS